MPVPSNFADAFDSIKAEQLAKPILPPVDPSRPPLVVETVPIEQADPETRARLGAKMAEMVQSMEDDQAATKRAREDELQQARIPGLGQARHAAAKASEEPLITVPEKAVPESVAAKVNPEVKRAAQPASSPTGADVRPAKCPHCEWDLAQGEDIAEPDQVTKLSFLHCMLGVKPFTQKIELFGGSIEVIFRSLTLGEVEAVYAQAFADQKAGKVTTELDYWEQVNRYRLYLQLQLVRSLGPNKVEHDLPDGLDKNVNSGAEVTWQDNNPPVAAGATLLPNIEEYITKKVLPQEAMFRVVNMACNRFNRLVAKLEAMADNSDFWTRTGEQS
jgi:hypothetical protein